MDYCEPGEFAQSYAKESPASTRFFMKRDNSGELEDLKEAKRREERARTAQLIQQAIEETYLDEQIEAKVSSKSLNRTIKATQSEGSIYRKLSFTTSEPPVAKSHSASPSLKSHSRHSNKPDLGMMVEAAHHPTYDEAYLRPFAFAPQEDLYFDDCMYASFDEHDDDPDHFVGNKWNAKSETIDPIITDRPTSAMDNDNHDDQMVPKPSATVVGNGSKKWRWSDLFSCTTI